MSKAFNSEEQAAITTTLCTADKNPRYSTNPGNDTKDKIFLLSINEADQYFKSDEDRKCVSSEYAKSKGAWTSSKYTAGGKATCRWWLRSPGDNQYYAADVYNYGSVYYSGHYVGLDHVAVRPAMWIKAEEDLGTETDDNIKDEETFDFVEEIDENPMGLERYSLITFDEDDKVVVVETLNFEGRYFVYVNEILPDESDITDVYKVMEIHPEDDTLEQIVDTELLNEILPRFYSKLEKHV